MSAQPATSTDRRRTPLLILVGIVLATILAIGVYAFTSSSDAVAEPLPDGVAEDGGIAVGSDGVVGSQGATGVPTVDIYYDFACSHCATFEEEIVPELDALAADGEIALVHHPVAILDGYFESAYSSRAAASAMAVSDTDPELFTSYVQALMGAQAAMPSTGYTDAELAQIADSVGVSQEGQDAIETEAYEVAATEATEAAVNGGLTGTPSVAVDGEFLDYTVTNYMQPGVLAEYIASVG